MTPDFTDRIGRVEPSATIAISDAAAELEADGVDVVDLSVGEPDFPTPSQIVDAAEGAIADGHTGYAPSKGIPALREAIAEYLAGDGLAYAPEEVIVTPGGKQALYEIFQTLIDDGDEVALLDPAWVSYEAMVKLAGGTLTRVDTAPADFGLEGSLPALREALSDDTELLVVNSPGNPHGAVYSRGALEAVQDLAIEHDITVVSDEIYKEIAYGDRPLSLGALDGMADRTITVNGFSKAYSMTGWRLGYFAAPEPIVTQAGKLQSHSVTCATHFVQYAGLAALEGDDDDLPTMVEAFEDRRDMLVEHLAEIGVDVVVPDGAFYLMLPVDGDAPEATEEDHAWCQGAIEEAAVATVPGSAFGASGYARISYAASRERLTEGIDRLHEAGYL